MTGNWLRNEDSGERDSRKDCALMVSCFCTVSLWHRWIPRCCVHAVGCNAFVMQVRRRQRRCSRRLRGSAPPTRPQHHPHPQPQASNPRHRRSATSLIPLGGSSRFFTSQPQRPLSKLDPSVGGKRPRVDEAAATMDPQGAPGGISDGFPCVRLRGLPFDVLEGDIKMFLVGAAS